ncbi:hypothetical protein BDZ97DRAFT_1981955 [Flammula alnicola]|nr:hypothetical protein BDZ97DRAFT_1981955 [Flammula alnicola]
MNTFVASSSRFEESQALSIIQLRRVQLLLLVVYHTTTTTTTTTTTATTQTAVLEIDVGIVPGVPAGLSRRVALLQYVALNWKLECIASRRVGDWRTAALVVLPTVFFWQYIYTSLSYLYQNSKDLKLHRVHPKSLARLRNSPPPLAAPISVKLIVDVGHPMYDQETLTRRRSKQASVTVKLSPPQHLPRQAKLAPIPIREEVSTSAQNP